MKQTFTKADCIFCTLDQIKPLAASDAFIAFYDKFPVTPSHVLIVPKQHRETYFDLNEDEASGLHAFIKSLKQTLCDQDPSISGFNIGMNCGQAAGQTVFHCHIHLIPRREGDIEDPRGGVRGVIPSKRLY